MTKPVSLMEATIDIRANRDPSGGEGRVRGAIVRGPDGHSDHPITMHAGDRLTFQFAETPEGKSGGSHPEFTAFRYQPIYVDEATGSLRLGKWCHPKNESSGPGERGNHIEYADDDRPPGPTMTIVDTAEFQTFFLYVVEWTDPDGSTWVCDPKIKNTPPPPDEPPKS